MSIAGEAPEPDFFFHGGPSIYRTFDFLPRDRRDRGGYQISTWWNEDDKEGNFWMVKKRRGKDPYAIRILQPNPNGVIWKKLADGELHVETLDDLLLMGQRQRERLQADAEKGQQKKQQGKRS